MPQLHHDGSPSRSPTGRNPVICIAENRLSCEPGVRLLIASLTHHSPTLRVELIYPGVGPDFQQWVAGHPQVRLNAHRLRGEWLAFNIKPQVMLTLLDQGYDDVLWIDSDIIVTADVRTLYDDAAQGAMIVTEEAMCSNRYDGDARRARAWGLEIGRRLPFELNTGVIGVTAEQRPLLHHWQEVLESPQFAAALRQPWDQRPIYFMGDQEVLTALLCSKPFADVPLHILRRGRDIIQFFGPAGYTVPERIRHLLLGPPTFIHAQGHKVWLPEPPAHSRRDRIFRAYQRKSPYIVAARPYRSVLEDTGWLGPVDAGHTAPAKRSFRKASLTGLSTALLVDAMRYVRWAHTGGEPRR